MNSEPVVTIGTVFTSLKLAVTAVIAVIALQLEMDANATVMLTSAGAALTIAIGDIVAYILTRDRVTPVSDPVLPIGTAVNERTSAPAGVVVAAPAAPGG